VAENVSVTAADRRVVPGLGRYTSWVGLGWVEIFF